MDWWQPEASGEAGRVSEMGEEGQKAQTFGNKRSWLRNVQRSD